MSKTDSKKFKVIIKGYDYFIFEAEDEEEALLLFTETTFPSGIMLRDISIVKCNK